MMKYTFLIHHSEQEHFLEKIGAMGIIDVTINDWKPNEEESRLANDITLYRQTIDKLSLFKTIHKNDPKLLSAVEIDKSQEAYVKNEKEVLINFSLLKSYDTPQEIIDNYHKAATRLDQLNALISKTRKEKEELEIWGAFDTKQINRLGTIGIHLHFFICGAKLYNPEWEEQYTILKVNEGEHFIHFVVVTCDDEPAPALNGATNIKTPSADFKDKEREIEELFALVKEKSLIVARCTLGIPLLEEKMSDMKEVLSENMIRNTNQKAAEGNIIIIEGWAPEEKVPTIDAAFDSEPDIITIKDKPTLEDNPPVLLKNNRFSRLCEMISKLYSLPNYHEIDLTPFFAPFFIFFVGMCFGDLGYALLIFVTVVLIYFLRKDKSIRPILSLVMWCCGATMLMGCITGTFFGLSLAELPAFKDVKFVGQMDLFSFALIVGLFQLLYAMFVKAIARMKYMGFKYGLSTLAWALTIITCGAAYLLPEMGITGFSMDSPIFTTIVIVLLLINILFSDPSKKNLLANIGGGVWDLYNSITGLLGDTLSYIRLFALGLSGGIIASVFNDLAIGMSGDVPVLKYIIMAIILLIGHGINIFMSAIGSFVHPLRLTFVEFYKNAGFEGGGREYKPFTKKKK